MMLAHTYNRTDISFLSRYCVMASFCNKVAQNDIILKMTSLMNKLNDLSPDYHNTTRTVPKSCLPPHSMNKLTLNESATIYSNSL